MDEEVKLTGKLVLDTTEAEAQLSKLASKGKKQTVSLPKDTEIELPKEATEGLTNVFKGDKGLKDVARIARGATGGIRGLLNSFSTLTSAGAAAAAVVGAVAAAIALVIKLLQGTDSFEYLITTLESLIDMIRESLAPALAMIVEVVTTVVDILKTLAPILRLLGRALAIVLTPVVALLKILEPLFKVLEKLMEVSEAISNIFGDTFMGIMNSFYEILFALIDMAIKPLLEWLNKLIEFFDTLKTKIQDFITKISGGLIKFDKDTIATTTASKKENFRTSLDVWQTSGDESAEAKKARLEQESAERLASVTAQLQSLFSGLGDKLKDIGGKIAEGAKEAWENIKGWAKGMWDSVGSFARNTWSNIQNWFNEIVEKIKALFGKAGEVAEDVKEGVKKGFDKVKEAASNVGSGIANVAGKVGDFAKGVGNKVKDFFSGMKFWDDGGTLGLGAQVWGMNEKGNPEFLFNAGGHDTVVNKAILSDALYDALVKAGANRPQKLEVGVKEGASADARELARWLLPSLKFLIKT